MMKGHGSILVLASLVLGLWVVMVPVLWDVCTASTDDGLALDDPSRLEIMNSPDNFGSSSPMSSSNLELWGPASTDNITKILDALDISEKTDDIHQRLWGKLKQSYNRLGNTEQQMFLDATGFARPINWLESWLHVARPWTHSLTVPEAKAVWSTCYEHESVGWNTLVDMSLLSDTQGEDLDLKMHNQLISLGESISSESWNDGNGMRVRDSDRALGILRPDMFSDDYVAKIVHLRISDQSKYIPRSGLSRLKNLKYLELEVAGFTEQTLVEDTFPRNLVLLQLHGGVANQLPFNPALLSRLTVLKLGNFERNPWSMPDTFGELSSLKILHIAVWKLETLPNTFAKLSKLERLTISSCDSLVSLPDNFGKLESLTHLTIEHCASFERLPESFGQLKALTHLTICDCQSFQSLGNSFAQLKALTHLIIKYVPSFQSLPHSFGCLQSLTHLSIWVCPLLQSLPDSFSQLRALTNLHIENCGLKNLPRTFGQLKRLEYLDIGNCFDLETLPESFKELLALRHLVVSRSSLKRIADSMDTLPSTLRTVELGGLPFLERFLGFSWEMVKFAESFVIFRLEDGGCMLEESEDRSEAIRHSGDRVLQEKYKQKLGRVKEKVRKRDYKGALKELDSTDLPLEPQRRGMVRAFLLLERGIVNQMAEDNKAALKDFNAAMEAQYKHPMHDYECRKHRGLTLFHIGDLEAARSDGQKALEIEPYDLYCYDVMNIDVGMTSHNLDWRPSPCQAEGPVAYSNFSFVGKQTVRKALHLFYQIQYDMTQKVWDMEYAGGLGIVERGMMDPLYEALPLKFQMQALRERGILKRFLGDLSGALADLTAAVEMASTKNSPDNYEARKHRGFVRYLVGDLEGAREDAEKAMKIIPEGVDKFEYAHVSRKGKFEYADWKRDGWDSVLKFLGGESVEYLGFNLK